MVDGLHAARLPTGSITTPRSRTRSPSLESKPSIRRRPENLTPWGPNNGTPPIYPSYPPPYQAPLRGIQIQIRAVDPTNQKIKSLTIRQDFTDKL